MNHGTGSGITDEQLSAWVDGELDALERDQVQAWLQTHPDDMARVRAWAADREALGRLFGSVLHEPAPDALKATVWRRESRTPPLWARAAAAAGLVVGGALAGGGLVWQWQQQRQQQQRRRARRHQRRTTQRLGRRRT